MKSLYRPFARRTARPWLAGLALVVLALVVAACAPSAAQAPAQAPTQASEQGPYSAPAAQAPTTAPAATSPAQVASGPATVKVSQNDQLGSFLVDDKGMTLYMYTKDTPNTSNCYDKCATAWPPLLTSGAAQAGAGADPSLLGTTTRKDGSTQVTYKGMPLYYYVKDTDSSDTYGQGVGGVWFVVSPAGEIIKAGGRLQRPRPNRRHRRTGRRRDRSGAGSHRPGYDRGCAERHSSAASWSTTRA